MNSYSFPKEHLENLIPGITNQQVTLLERFAISLKEWNQRFNLISRKDIDHIWENHILPSLIPLTLIEFSQNSWVLDIGSGGGFPALPMKIIRSNLQMLLVDSVRKKTLFLQKTVSDLHLKHIAIKRERIESLNTQLDFLERFDIITARAVANILQLIKWSKPFLKRNGFLLLWKGYSDLPELESVSKSLNLNYKVITIPDAFKKFSSKFEELCFFKIYLT
jgi:16S rRNA (guanine527-N7)-methyltransferase